MPIAAAIEDRRHRFTDPEIQQIAQHSRESIAQWVRATAVERGITYAPTPSDRFAREASRLSDAAADLDAIEYLLLALRRARVLTRPQRVRLQGGYLR